MERSLSHLEAQYTRLFNSRDPDLPDASPQVQAWHLACKTLEDEIMARRAMRLHRMTRVSYRAILDALQ